MQTEWVGFALREGKRVSLLFSDDSASLILSSRAWLNVERESVMREQAVLSGAMLKLWIVWWMSCVMYVSDCRIMEILRQAS